jgi:hypothetical protein
MHDSFVRGRPDLLIDVRRLPQRIAASVAKMNKQLKVKVKTSKGSSKVLVSNSSKPSALSRMTSCLKSKQHESSDESEGNSESEYESPNFTPTLNHNSSIESEDGSEENNNVFISQEYEGFVSFLDGNEDILPQIDEEELDHHHQKDQDGIVKVQPLPKECYVPSSSIATISEGVNQMAIEKLSPRIAFAKHTNVHINENNNNTKPWSVKFNKPTTPNSLQSMIPVLGRCDSSMTKISESDNNDDDDVKLSTFLENEIETLEKEQPFSDSNRSKSFTVDTAILQEFASPPVFSSRLSSDDWNMTEPQQLTNNQLTTMFSLARKESIEAPPQPILMERR